MILGLDVAGCRKSGIDRVLRMVAADLPRGVDDHVLTLSRWANSLTEDEKRMALGIAEVAIEGALFKLLVTLDGATGGSWIRPEITAYELVLTVGDGETVKERLSLNLPEDGDLHEELYPAVEGKPESL